MSKINYILKGRHENSKVDGGTVLRSERGALFTKKCISSYQLIDETNKSQYSFLKGAVGAALFGGIGAIAGIGGKNKKEYLVLVQWKEEYATDGEDKSLLLLDDKMYKVFIQGMF